MTTKLASLPPYPFPRLNALLDGIEPGMAPLALSVGEPQHQPPGYITDILAAHKTLWNKYPPVNGTPDLRRAIAGSLAARYPASATLIDADTHILPVAGTREALYMISDIGLDEAKTAGAPLIMVPNPLYQPYAAAALMKGAQLRPMDATPATGFLPDLNAVSEAEWAEARMLYLCSPANPQGKIADTAYLQHVLEIIRTHDLILIMDECYADIYDTTPPKGLLEVIGETDGDLSNVLVCHSLSKRCSAAGVRSGFMAGDAGLISRFTKLRSYGAPVLPLPVQAVSARLWRDRDYVNDNRAAYRAKIDAAEEILGDWPGFERPEGGFFLWLNVGDGEDIATKLWAEKGVKTIPGGYLTLDGADGTNHGHAYLRIALVHDLDICREALTRIRDCLGTHAMGGNGYA